MIEKRNVPLSAVRPSKGNPRRDFGDIAALADTIRATGGEPVNPIVVVRDGNVYRIVDGERRYRALREIYRSQPDREVQALVSDGMDEANELVAMLATDDKQQLTDEERARGVQQMLVLGVDERRVAKAARVSEGKVVAARRMAKHTPEGAQLTLDQMEAASRFADPADRDAVLAAGDAWRAKADAIARRVQHDGWLAGWRALFHDAGVDVVERDGKDPLRRPDGSYLGGISESVSAAEFSPEDLDRGGEWGGEVETAYVAGCRIELYGEANDEEEDAEEAEADREAKRALDAHRADMTACWSRMLGHLASESDTAPDVLLAASAWLREKTDWEWRERSARSLSAAFADAVSDAVAGRLDALLFAANAAWITTTLYSAADELRPAYCERFADFFELMMLDGWSPTDADRALYLTACSGRDAA